MGENKTTQSQQHRNRIDEKIIARHLRNGSIDASKLEKCFGRKVFDPINNRREIELMDVNVLVNILEEPKLIMKKCGIACLSKTYLNIPAFSLSLRSGSSIRPASPTTPKSPLGSLFVDAAMTTEHNVKIAILSDILSPRHMVT